MLSMALTNRYGMYEGIKLEASEKEAHSTMPIMTRSFLEYLSPRKPKRGAA